jgi:hypothetical protein
MEGFAARTSPKGTRAKRTRRALTLGATALALAAAAAGCGGDDDSEVVTGPAEPVTAADPAVAFAPLVHLHSKERLFPMAAGDFVAASKLKWATDGCPDDTLATSRDRSADGMDRDVPVFTSAQLARPAFRRSPLAADCSTRRPMSFTNVQHTRPYDAGRPAGLPRGDGFYLDALTDSLRGARRVERNDSRTLLATSVPVYYERNPERVAGGPGLRLTYWLFYGYQELALPYEVSSLLEHEGDWERVSVLLRRLPGDRRYEPVSARFDAHGRGRELPWESVRRVPARSGGQATHPVVYAARGSHTPYPSAGLRTVTLRPENKPLAVREHAEACDDCPQWRTWKAVLPVRRQPWYDFGGGWGLAYERAATSGPRGPMPH